MRKSQLVKFLITIMVFGFVSFGILGFGSVQTVNASSLSVPEFTVTLEAHPYYEPPVYEIDPYTGKNMSIISGQHVENKSIFFTIKNNPFTPYTVVGGHLVEMFYRVRAKGHFEESWKDLDRINASNSEYTIKSYPIGKNADIQMLRELFIGDMVDFQVQEQIGYIVIEYDFLYAVGSHLVGESSSFSDIQTLTISSLQTPTPSPTPTSTPITEPFPTTIAVASVVIIAVIGIGILVYFKKYKKK